MMRRRRRLAQIGLAFCFGVLHTASIVAANLSGKVVGVIDGDTIDLLLMADQRSVRIRLAEIDAPERRQPFGARAKQELASIAFGRLARVDHTSTDRYGRIVGTVFIESQNVNRVMVARGMAWAYRRYLVDLAYIEIETRARAARIGLWRDDAPTAPWMWRTARSRARERDIERP